MDYLLANALLTAREDRSAFPFFMELDGVDAWPEMAVAAVALSGCLDDARTDEDLDEGLAHFRSLMEIGVFDADALKRETLHVIAAVMEYGRQHCGWEPAPAGVN